MWSAAACWSRWSTGSSICVADRGRTVPFRLTALFAKFPIALRRRLHKVTGAKNEGMSMRYHAVGSFDEAAKIAAAAKGTVRFLAGGTDVLVQMRAGMVQPDD